LEEEGNASLDQEEKPKCNCGVIELTLNSAIRVWERLLSDVLDSN
jgi:hypothetical protein